MPIKKYMLHVDGKDRQVSVSNIDKYGMDSYAKSYPDATIRMRDDKDSDYDIPIGEYQRAVDSGLRPFVTSFYKDEEEEITERSTFKPDSIAYITPPATMGDSALSGDFERNDSVTGLTREDITQGKREKSVPETVKTGTEVQEKVPEKLQLPSDSSVLGQPNSEAARESTFVAEIPTERELEKPVPVDYNYKPEVQEHIANNIPDMFKSDGKSLMDKPLNVGTDVPEGDWEGKKYGARFDAAVNYYHSDTFEKRQKKEVGDHLKALSGDVLKSLDKVHEKIRGNAAQGGNAANALMGSAAFNRDKSGERQEIGRLNAAKSLIEDSENLVRESGLKEESGFFGGLGRGFKDEVFNAETWSMGLAEMANGKYLYDAVEKVEKGEKLTPSEEKLLDAAVINMAVNAYYGSDVGMGYKAGQMTGASIPFMLELAVNPVSSAGSGIAKSILKYGMKKMGSGIAKTGVAKAGARLVGDAIAAGGVTATTGLGGVGAGVVDRMTGQVKFGIDRDGQLTYQGREGQMEARDALPKSVATNLLERQSEMIFNAFKGAGGALWGAVSDHLPDGVTDFMKMAKQSKIGKLYKELKDNPALREVAERTQFHGLPEEYMEEVYNNFANVALGEMTLEEATDLQNNIEIMLGLAPTSVFFGLLGGAGLAYEKAKNRQAMQNKDEAQQKLFEELKKDSAEDEGALKDFVSDVVADEEMEPETKKDTMDTAFRVAADNAADDIILENTTVEEPETEAILKPVLASRILSNKEGARIYAEHDPAKMREAVVRERVSYIRLYESVLGTMTSEDIQSLVDSDDVGREEILSTLDSNQRRLAEDYLAQADTVEGMNEALDTAHNAEVEAAESLTRKMTSPTGNVMTVTLGKYGSGDKEYGIIVSGIDPEGNPTSPEGQVIVVPITSVGWTPDYSTFDEANAITMVLDKTNEMSEVNPDIVAESMLGEYQADANLLKQQPLSTGQQISIADEEGNLETAQVVGQSLTGGWLVLEEGQNEPIDISSVELRQMMYNAEKLPIMQEYAQKDAAYEREQKEIQRQTEREARKAREAEEAARIAEEMKKPINRLAKYPEGHKKAGMPDYENSRPEDVREYLIETLGLVGAVKSIRSQRADLEKQVAEQYDKLESIIRNNEESDYLPDEAIAAREIVQQEQDKAYSLNKRLDFWKGVERITAGPSEKEAQEAVIRSVAQQKAAKTKSEVYKPSEEYRKMQQTMAGSEVALDVLNDLEPHTPEELAAQLISGGVRLMKSDETIGDTVLKGVQSMTGYGNKDLQRLNFIFATRANGGVSVSEFGEMLELAAKDAGIRFDGTTQEEGTNALLSLLSDVETMGDINRYVERNRMNQASRLYEDEQNAIYDAKDAAAWEEYGMSYADYKKLQDAITDLVEIRQTFTQDFWKSDAYNDFISNFAGNISDNGQEGNDIQGSGSSIGENSEDDGRGNEVSSGGNQEPTGGVQPPIEVAAGREPNPEVQETGTENQPTNDVGDGSAVPDGQGDRSDEGRTEATVEQIEQAKQLANEAIAEVSKEIQGRPVYVVGSLEDLDLYRNRVGEEIFAKIEGGYNEPGALASYMYDLNEIFLWANKAAEYGASKQNLKASIYHENLHALLYGDRYTSEEFKAFADQIRKAFPDIAEYVENRYSSQPESIRDEEVVTRYVEDLVDSRLESLMLTGEGRIEGDTDAIGEELNHVINLLKDRKYEREGRDGRRQTLSVGNRPEDGQKAHRLQEDVSSEKQESVQSMEKQGAVGTSEGVGMAGREELYGSVQGNGSAGEGSEGRKLVPTTGRDGKEGNAETYVVEKRHHAKLGQDVWAVKFTERFDRGKFLELKKEVKKFRGYYSSYGKGGFIFEDEAHARKFAESVVGVGSPAVSAIEQARTEVNTSPTDAQKEAGNYKMGHVKLDGYDITIENPKGSVRSGKDTNGKEWSITMNNDYGYIRGTKAVDGDHIDVFLSDNPEEGRVFVVDQTNADGSFDESKVMYGFNSMDEARNAYLSNYDAGWESRIMAITEVSKDEFKKWIDSSTRKTKAFSDYKSVKPSDPVQMPKKGDFLKNNIAGADAVAVVRGVGEDGYLVAYAPGMEEAESGAFMGEQVVPHAEMEQIMREGGYTPIKKQENELKPTYDEQGRETIESQAGHSRGEAGRLAGKTESGSVEDETATGRGSGTGGNRPAESAGRSGKPETVNGFRIGEKVLYKGKEATIYDFENDGTPVLDTGMAPVIYEVGYWDNIQKMPTTVEQITRIADAQKPAKKLERAEQRKKRNQPKREKQKEQMADLFAQVDAMEEKLARQDQEIDAQLALLGEYKAGPKAQVREDMHTGAAKTLEKAGRKFAKSLASRLGGHVDGKELSRGITNIAPIGGDMVFRVWMDDAETQGVMLLINFDAAPDTQDFDKLVPKYGFWRLISDKDISGVRNDNHNFAIDDVKKLESGAFMTKVADAMLKEINKVVLTEKTKEDGRNQAENSRMGTEARQEAGRTEPGRDDRGVHGNNVPDTHGSGRVSERDGEQQPSVNEPSPVAASVKRNTRNWSYGEKHLELPSGEIGKLKGNIEAIRTLKELEASGQPATPEQKQALLKFVGWGGLAEALNSAEYAEWQSRVKNGRMYGWGESLLSTAWSKKWGKHYEDLRPLMTDEEWATAQASTLNSHYTPETVIRGLWEALEYMGFKGGSILEPAMGVGHILGFMPKGISERSVISGFELDSIPGRIAKQLYPDADIRVAGYETAFRPGSKDAVVTNVPFGQTAPVDPALDKALRKKLGSSYNLHNYFIIKGLLELRQGGVGAFITSSATMDGRNTKAREYISSLGVDLVGAIRLPNNTFKSNAGTEVTADILFFRKRLPGESTNGIGFTSLTQVGVGKNKVTDKKGKEKLVDVPLFVNEYFAERPEMMLGTVMTAHDAGSGGLYGGDNLTLVARPGTELSAELADAIGLLPENVFEKGTVSGKAAVPGEATTQKDGTLSVKDGKVYVASKGELTEVASGSFKHNGKTRSYADATTEYQAMKETLKELIQAEQMQAEDPVELRKKLNEQYDRFVEKYGRLNENKNLNVVMDEDPERFLPQALEKVETVTNPTTGRRTKVVSKGTGILAQRVSQPMTEPTSAESLGDAIGISQAYRGRMDVEYIGRMLGISTDEARERILTEREAYEDPVTGDLVDRDAYLSGNIREKLDAARAAAENDSRYETNVADLEKAMPESIPFVDIFYKMGTPWIPEDVYESFAEEVVGLSNVEVSYTPAIDQFVVNKGHVSDYTKSNSFTTTRRDALQVFEDAINLRKPTIMKTVYINGEERSVKDEQATQEAIQAIMDMNDAFIQYIQEAKPLHARLTNIYNDRYNNYRLREYREPAFKGEDGKVHYPNANPGITLRTHQVKAVQRSLIGSTLLAHQVGTGKTFTMITTAMEMRRLGIAKKPMIVVQNATLQDFAADFMKLYPSAKILVPNETERSASQRKRLFNLIATGDFDAIIVPQSFLAFIPDDEGRKKAMIQARVDEIMNAAESLQFTDKRLADKLKREAESLSLSLSGEEKGGKKKNVKKEAKKEESALVRETRKFDRKTDDVLTFEQMGVDALFIDEAHNYKKIGFTTKMQNVKGVDTGYSERANSLYLKVSYVQEKNGGRNVVLATGTPITNTMAEVWTMMRFVAPEILEDYGIRTFDEFAATFGQVEPSLEQNSTGGFKIADRFKSYVNVPELVKAFRSHADVVLTTDVEEFKQSKNIPKLKDGQMTNHVIQKSDKLQEVMDVLISALAEDEKKSGKEKTPGLPLVVFSKAKQAAIDLRLINPEYPDDPNSKTNKVVSEVMRIYKESTPDKGIQMIFCDSYQSPASAPAIDLFDYDPDVPQFNLYRDIKNKLVEAGIPKEEIVIVSEITNAERKKAVFEKARAGVVRVLIGGTEKMGVGVNVQDRMIALHHMDAPIRPMDFEQRNGRILRQGNIFAGMDKPVEVLTYGVEGTLDATAYERLRIKQDFINQMMKGDVSGRVMEESDDEDPSGKTFSQMAAELSGDKTLQLLFVAENKVKRLEGLRRSHEMKREAARVEAAMLKTDISRLKNRLKDAERMGEEIAKGFPEGVTKLTINGRPVTEKLSKVLAETLEKYEERYALNRSVVFPLIELNDKAAKMVFGHDAGQLNYSLFVDKFQLVDEKPINSYAGAWLSLNSALSNSGKRAAEIRETIAKDEARIKGAESIQEKDFDKMDELKQYRAEVKKLKEELAKKAEKPVPGAEEVKLAKKNLKSGEKPVSLPEEMAGDSEESLERMETAMKPYEEVAVNAPETVVAMGASDILKAMPNVSTMQFASIVKEASRPEVQAMYVPWTRQIIMLPKHGTVKEMRDKRWHESFHFGIDMVLPQGDEGRLMLERAASEADKLAPALTKWVEDTYGDHNTAEEKVVHILEEVISYMEDAGRVKALRGGLDFGSQYPVLNDVANRIINYLTNNDNGKESNDYSGYDEGNQPADRRKNQGWENEEDLASVRGSASEEEVKLGLRGKPRRKAGESLISYNRRLKEWQAEVEEAKRTREVENMDVENPLDTELNDLAMEMMNHPSPIRKRGESDEDFNARHAEWSEWYNTRRPEIERRIAEIKVMLESEKAAARNAEMNRVDERLYEGTIPDQKDSEGHLSDEEMREVREIFQEKMGDMGIAIDREQAKRDIKQEIIERRRYIETSNLEDTFFVDKIKKVAGSKEVLKAIPDYIEGTYTGEVTSELVEASKLVNDWFEEVYNLMAQEGVLYDAAKIQNYVTHIWDWKRSPMEAQQKFNNYVNTMRLRSPFTKHRVVPTYKEGIAMGMVPKYDDITGILLEYGHYATETIANKRMVEYLKTFKVFVPGGKDNLPMEVDLIVPDTVRDPMYQRMNHTALDGYKVLADYHKYIKPVFGDQRILDHKQMSEFANKLTQGIWTVSSTMKKVALSFSFFHHGALTETAIAMLGPAKAGKVIAKNLIWDVITKGNIPALNDKEAARDAVKHLVSLGASNDYITADVNNLTGTIRKLTEDKNIPVAKQAAQLLDFLNRGSDKFLWDTIHDGFKIASFAKMAKETRAKAERERWSQMKLEKALDECGHLVNDTFGGLHFDILGFSPKEVRIMRALLLSPDWTLATIRQALSPLGFGKLYGDEGFWKTIAGGENPVRTRKKYGRQFWVTAMIFFYALMNGLNAYFRAMDEDEQKRIADEMRKTNPGYKSPYELAYPDGMKWYDYTMLGNTLGHQSHLFTGRYEDGTETYARWGKQFRELPELFFGRDGFSIPGPMIDKMAGKANPFMATAFEFVSGYSLSGWENQFMKGKKGWERDVARLYLLASKFVPYSIPTQEDKDFYWLDLVMPSSKGFTPGKAINYFEKAIASGGFDFVAGVYDACVKNGLNPEKYFDVAKARIEATAKANMLEGVESVQDAAKLFDEATDVKEKKRYLRYMEQQTGAQDYQAISEEEMIQKAKDVVNGEDVKVDASDFYLEHATSDDVLEDYRMKKNAAGLKKYYQDYTELMMEDPVSGRRMLQEKRKFIEGYQLTTKYRSAINKAKKAMKEDNRLGTDQIMKEVRRLRKEYFKKMDEMELK